MNVRQAKIFGLGEPASPTRFEQIYLVLTLVIFLAVPFLVGNQPQGAAALNPIKALKSMTTQGDSSTQLLMVVLYLGAVVALLRWTRFRMSLFLGTPLLLLVAWCFISAAWSIDPNVSIRRSTALFGTVILGIYMGLRFDLRAMLRVMSYVTGIVLIGSLVVAVLWPSLGEDFEGRLRGVFTHKNSVPGFASIALLMLVAQLIDMNYPSRLAAIADGLLACICIVCMVWSRSAGAVPVLLVALPLIPITRFLRTADKGVMALIPMMACFAIAALVVATYNSDTIAAMLGRDADISGRTLIWEYTIKMFFERPWLGYGYSAFWEGFNTPGGVFRSISNLGVPNSHNGYIELALDAGGVGLVLFLIAMISLTFKLAWLVRHGSDPLISWVVAFLSLLLVDNLIETRLWVGNSHLTVFLVYIVVYANLSVQKTLSESRHRIYSRAHAPGRLPVLRQQG